ncbi:MAG: hypothetical protein ABH851_01955 [Methanobacteriota archaeon]
MMPPGVAPPKKVIKEEVRKEIKKDQKESITKEVERQAANPEAPLHDLEGSMNLVPDSKFLESTKPAERAAEKISGEGDDDDDDDDDDLF